MTLSKERFLKSFVKIKNHMGKTNKLEMYFSYNN